MALSSRFNRELRRLHGDDIEFVEIQEASYAPISTAPWVARARSWWRRQSPLERVWLVWLWAVLGSIGLTIGVMSAAVLSSLSTYAQV